MSYKTALITGGSRGIGAAIALKLASNNVNIVITYNSNKEAAEDIANQAKSFGVAAYATKADFSSEENIKNLFDFVKDKIGYISYLINNAAISSESKKVSEITYDDLERIFQTNFFAAVIASKYSLEHMKYTNGGSIINISSEAATYGGINMSHYAATKSALNIFTKAFAKEAAEYGVRVNAISPAVIDTDAHKDISKDRKKYLKESIPLGRMGRAEEVAELALWLCSDKASYVSGSIIPITGGR